jgi:two-component system sensor histidine kinase HydH
MSPTRLKNRLHEVKPFRLVKNFAIASFIVLILISFPFSLFISQKAKEILFKHYEDYALELGSYIDSQVLQGFTLPMAMQFGEISLRNKQQMETLDSVIRKATETLNVDVVKLHSFHDNKVIYSTDPSLINEKSVKTDGYMKALKGEMSSELISEGKGLWGLGKVRTYIPLKIPLEKDEFFINGILEMVLDMTEQYRSIVKLQYLIFGTSILMMALIFFALLFIVHKAEQLIRRRIMEQRELEEQLNLAERLAALGEMVAGVSHEIKNPLGIIQSTAELLSSMPDAGEKQKRLSGVITEESIRLNRIVTEFLDFARPHELNIQESQLEEIIQKNIDFLKPEMIKKGISIKTNIDGRGYKISVDQDLIHRALMNLIMNSMQAMENGGTISLGVTDAKGGYNITIQDSGSGITSDNIKKIFNPFFTTKEKGSGLGLPIVRKIIEGHHGTIDIESNKGEGTKVTIHLPKKFKY